MFKQTITSTALNTEAANQYFAESITGESWQRDFSFLSTLRALLASRVKDGEHIHLTFGSSTYSADQLAGLSASRALSTILGGYDEYGYSIRVHNFNNMNDAANAAWLEMMEKNMESNREGWHRIPSATLFFRRVFKVLCFINPELKSVFLFTERMDIRRMHYLQCGIPAFFPWYYTDGGDVLQIEMDLVNSLREKTPDLYLSIIEQIASAYDFQTARIRQLLRGFETRYERTECERAQNNLTNIIQQLNNLQNRIGDYLKQKRDTEILLLGLQTKIAQGESGDSELMEYFLCNKSLILQNVEGSTITFVVHTTMDYFDDEAAESYIDNDSSYFYSDYGSPRRGTITREEMKMLMQEIFINQTLKVHLCAAYSFSLEGSITAISGYRYGGDCGDSLPNPHIDSYSCLGNYQTPINTYLRDRDYISAIEQCVASCKSLNIGDYAVMSTFVNRMYGHDENRNIRCIELPDGTIVTPKDAVEYLKKGKETEENG